MEITALLGAAIRGRYFKAKVYARILMYKNSRLTWGEGVNMINLLAATGFSMCVAEIKQDAHQLVKAGNSVVGLSSNEQAEVVEMQLANKVLNESDALRKKLSQFSTRVIDLVDIEVGELNKALGFLTSTILQFSGQVEFIRAEIDFNGFSTHHSLDEKVLNSILKVRNDFEKLYLLLKQFEEDEVLETGAFFKSKKEALDASTKGLVALGFTPNEAVALVQ